MYLPAINPVLYRPVFDSYDSSSIQLQNPLNYYHTIPFTKIHF